MERWQIFEGNHLSFMTLNETVENNKYLRKIQKKWIPAYPRPELHVFHLSHSTDLRGFCGIRRDGGFRDPRKQEFVWFSLTVSPQELREAEDRDLILVHPGGDEQRVRPHRPQRRAEEEQEFRADRKRTCGEDEEEFTAKKHRETEEEKEGEREQEEIKEEEKPQEELTAAQQELKIKRKPQTAADNSLRNIPDERKGEEREEEGAEEGEETKTEERAEEEGEEEKAEKTTDEQREEGGRAEEVSVTSETSKPSSEEKASETSEARSETDFLLKFASSPSFSSRSRYGSFRFTFRIREVLDQYKRQFCGGQEPVLRVFQTVLYSQEVMYAVLVHSPVNNRKFLELPLLEETPHCICAFRTKPEPHFIWRPEAMSETHRFALVLTAQNTLHTQATGLNFFLWDHVTLALHVDRGLLEFSDLDLRNNLSYCEADKVSVPKGPGAYPGFHPFEKAEEVARERWPRYRLQKFNQTHFHIPDFTPEIHKVIKEEQ